MPPTKEHPTLVHVKAHAASYVTTALLGSLATVLWLGGQSVLDIRYAVADEHAQVHEQHTVDHSQFLDLYLRTEREKKLSLLKKDLRKARREKRRFDAYIAADPESKVLQAREQSAAELTDVIDELEEDLVTMQAQMAVFGGPL